MLSSSRIDNDLKDILDFLHTPTPDPWLLYAVKQLPTLLIDHAHCERKAATTALNYLCKYSRHPELVAVMSPLAREELLHFEKVLQLMAERNIAFGPLKPSSYAQTLRKHVIQYDYLKHLADELIIGAIIEARSCERFYALTSCLEDQALVKFYRSLVKAEARHFQDYLKLARLYSPEPIEPRLDFFLEVEKDLILMHDGVFRFHGGVPRVSSELPQTHCFDQDLSPTQS